MCPVHANYKEERRRTILPLLTRKGGLFAYLETTIISPSTHTLSHWPWLTLRVPVVFVCYCYWRWWSVFGNISSNSTSVYFLEERNNCIPLPLEPLTCLPARFPRQRCVGEAMMKGMRRAILLLVFLVGVSAYGERRLCEITGYGLVRVKQKLTEMECAEIYLMGGTKNPDPDRTCTWNGKPLCLPGKHVVKVGLQTHGKCDRPIPTKELCRQAVKHSRNILVSAKTMLVKLTKLGTPSVASKTMITTVTITSIRSALQPIVRRKNLFVSDRNLWDLPIEYIRRRWRRRYVPTMSKLQAFHDVTWEPRQIAMQANLRAWLWVPRRCHQKWGLQETYSIEEWMCFSRHYGKRQGSQQRFCY